MFWRFGGYANISAIDTILEKQDVTLEELLDESDLIQELKQHNTKLIEFLRDEGIIRKLLEYVTAPKPSPAAKESKTLPVKVDTDASIVPEEPSAEDSNEQKKKKTTEGGSTDPEKKDDTEQTVASVNGAAEASKQLTDQEREQAERTRLKYSYVSCEVLSSEAWSICEALMDNLDNLRTFWKFLERPAPLDPLQAGYFTKVNETLLDKKTEEMMGFFKSIDNIVIVMLKHVDCPMIMDLLLKIISMEKSEGGHGIVDWLQSKDLIPRLLSFLSTSNTSTTQTSTGDFLKAIITISANASQNEQSCIGPNNLTRQLVSESCIQMLINQMLRGGNPLTVGVGIIIEVIRKNNSDYDPEIAGGIDSVPSGRDPIYLGTLLKLFAKHVPDFMKLITSQEIIIRNPDGTTTTKKRELKAAFGAIIEPLGFDRFKTCELMAELLHCSNMGLLNERGSEEYVKQRDQERDRLKAERERDLATLKSLNSPITSVASEDHSEGGRTETSRAPDDDGFEDVTVMGVLGETNNNLSADELRRSLPSSETAALEPIPTNNETSTRDDHTLSSLTPNTEGLRAPSPVASTSNFAPPSPTTEISSNIGEMSFDEDTEMRSASPPAAEDLTTHKADAPDLSITNEKADETMSTPPSSVHDTSEGSNSVEHGIKSDGSTQATIGSEKTSTEQSKDDVPKIVVGGESLDLGLDPALLQYDGIDLDIGGRPLVGDYLKMMFVQFSVVPTILDFFFRFPWNNFLHNVVYDVVQQVFNGPMDRGFNLHLAIDLFEKGEITQRIMDGDYDSYLAQKDSNMRLGYMGHLTLIAEEVVKFTERHDPAMLSRVVMDKIMENNWILYVETTLAETRERDNAILGGVRPDLLPNTRQAGLGSAVVSQTFGGSLAGQNATVETGLDTIELQNSGVGEGSEIDPSHDEAFGGAIDEQDNDIDNIEKDMNAQDNSRGEGVLSSGFGSSSDDDDEDEEMGMGEDEDDDEVARLGMGGSSDQVRYLQVLLSQEVEEDDVEDDIEESGGKQSSHMIGNAAASLNASTETGTDVSQESSSMEQVSLQERDSKNEAETNPKQQIQTSTEGKKQQQSEGQEEKA